MHAVTNHLTTFRYNDTYVSAYMFSLRRIGVGRIETVTFVADRPLTWAIWIEGAAIDGHKSDCASGKW
jgi:hypothetical protein